MVGRGVRMWGSFGERFGHSVVGRNVELVGCWV